MWHEYLPKRKPKNDILELKLNKSYCRTQIHLNYFLQQSNDFVPNTIS